MFKAKSELTGIIKSKDLGEISYVLGVRILRNRPQKAIYLDQSHMCTRYIDRHGITGTASTLGFWKDDSKSNDQKESTTFQLPRLETSSLQSMVSTLGQTFYSLPQMLQDKF